MKLQKHNDYIIVWLYKYETYLFYSFVSDFETELHTVAPGANSATQTHLRLV